MLPIDRGICLQLKMILYHNTECQLNVFLITISHFFCAFFLIVERIFFTVYQGLDLARLRSRVAVTKENDPSYGR
jgi:hypothetical protein